MSNESKHHGAAQVTLGIVSLKRRAVALLAQRDHSELELRRKLLRVLERSDAAVMGASSSSADDVPALHLRQIDEVIVWLRASDYLNEERFIESRVRARAARSGMSRIRAELVQLGLVLPPQMASALKAGELERAQTLWSRRFGQPARDLRERARQARFLTARGFSPEVVARVLRGLPGDDADAEGCAGRGHSTVSIPGES